MSPSLPTGARSWRRRRGSGSVRNGCGRSSTAAPSSSSSTPPRTPPVPPIPPQCMCPARILDGVSGAPFPERHRLSWSQGPIQAMGGGSSFRRRIPWRLSTGSRTAAFHPPRGHWEGGGGGESPPAPVPSNPQDPPPPAPAPRLWRQGVCCTGRTWRRWRRSAGSTGATSCPTRSTASSSTTTTCAYLTPPGVGWSPSP